MNALALDAKDHANHSVFSAMMKQWRSVRKISQLDLSLDAGISQRHLSFLESGRSKPSREMVMNLAQVLDLSLRDRNQLLNAAGFAAVYEERGLDDNEMRAVNRALELTLKHHDPFPAIVVDRNWNLKMQNNASLALVQLLGEPEEIWQKVDPSGDKNVYRMTFHPEGMQPLISNWQQLASTLVMRLQREVAADPSNEYLAELLDEVRSYSSETESLVSVDEHATMAPVLPMELSAGDITLKTFSMVSSFGTALDVTAEELKVESFFPADDFTEAFFRQMGQGG